MSESTASVDDTIVAIATPPGEGGLGVVRLSGPASFPIAAQFFSSPANDLQNAATHTLHHGWIGSNGHIIDEVVAALFRAPRSYTGEDVVELSCHGSPAVLNEILLLCLEKGARLSRPGEFTERAFLNGKMDLIQAEAVSDLIQARSHLARRAATYQLRGGLSSRIETIRGPLLDLLAQIEANLDFAEEDIPGLSHDQLLSSLEKLSQDLAGLLSTSLRGRLLREGLRVAIAGRPNVGKSSLFNALLAQDRAIVTHVPGTTRDTLEEQVQWDGLNVILTDTAGLRDTADPVELLGTERTRGALSQADIVLCVLDSSQNLTDEDRALLTLLKDKQFFIALNKCDLPRMLDEKTLFPYGAAKMIQTSARFSQGLNSVKEAVGLLSGARLAEAESAPVLTNLRHIERLEAALKRIQRAQKAVSENQSEETLSSDLRAALLDIHQITGHDASEELLNTIFSRFCIGK